MQHSLEPGEGTLHGWFRPDRAPCLTVDSGDTVRFRTLDVGAGLGPMDERRTRFAMSEEGPCLHGPVAVRGARPGDTLAVTVKEIRTASWGWTLSGGPGFLNQDLNRRLGVADEPRIVVRWQLEGDQGVDQDGYRTALRPFPGILGVAGPEPLQGWFPHAGGGNMDCPELTVGATLYLPVLVEGALLSVGDGHAAQGEGELSGTAIECPFERIELELELVDEPSVPGPHIRRGDRWVTLGFAEDLDDALAQALNLMLDLLMRLHGVGRARALALASVFVDLRFTQLVNGRRGVHAIYRPPE